MRATAKRPSTLILWTLAILINLGWAIAYPLSKNVIGAFPAMGLAMWRMAGGALILLPLIRRTDFPRSPSRKDLILLALMGVVGCALSTLLQFIATERTLASNISLIVALETIAAMFLAHFFLRERSSLQGWGGAIIAFAGVGLITINPESGESGLALLRSDHALGNGLMVLSVMCYATYTIIGKILAPRWGSGALTALPLLLSAILFVPVFLLTDPEGFSRAMHPTLPEWGVIFLVGCLGAGFGFMIWNWLLNFMSASALSRTLYVQPVSGVIFSAWLLGETITPVMIAGGVMVVGGILLSEWRRS